VRIPAAHRVVFSCPGATPADDIDHVLRRELAPTQGPWPSAAAGNPFIAYRELLHSWHVARARGLADSDYVDLVQKLDRAVASVDGRGFSCTPFQPHDALSAALGLGPGGLWVKVEASNVSGSHKARHLMGLMLSLAADAAEPRTSEPPLNGTADEDLPRLAIASCGNAALAAAVVARAAGRALDVFVPTWANPGVLSRLHALGARIATCERRPGVAGDPCYHRFHDAVRAGAVPFCCQGPDNGLTIEGGCTLAWEMADQLGGRPLDRVFVQVGGGALASACAQGLADAVRLGRLARLPRLHAVQTRGGHPLVRAYQRVLDRVLGAMSLSPADSATSWDVLARRVAERPDVIAGELRFAAAHRSHFMWPWESEPVSIATGILDDETYDWLAVVEGMLLSGGYPVVVEEETLREANARARAATRIAVCHTGTAGLAGLMTLRSQGVAISDESCAVVFSGAMR
jgi:threonine synthase